MEKPEIRAGAAYSNGEFGNRWAVRQVIAIEPCPQAQAHDRVEFKVLAGKDRRARLNCTRAEFARWARYRVVRNENSWERAEDGA